MIKVVVFDFDDCLVWSEQIKHDAYLIIFSGIKGADKIVRKVDKDNIEQPRNVVIERILKALEKINLIHISDFETTLKSYVERYATYVEDAILKAEKVPGAVKAVSLLSDKYHLCINSATPQEYIDRVIEKIGWSHYFRGIYGAPPGTKTEHLKEIIKIEKVSSKEVVVIGDGKSDLSSAQECKTHFIGLRTKMNNWSDNENFPTIKNHFELPRIITNL